MQELEADSIFYKHKFFSLAEVILVDGSDVEIGRMDKLVAHQQGKLHRAFSIFIFNSEGEYLLHQRAGEKYHSAKCWTNACCSHPAPGETTEGAALRRLQEEMGFKTEITKAFEFTYRTTFDNGLTEHEFDHVFTGTYEGNIAPDPAEVRDWKFVSGKEIREMIEKDPSQFSYWFCIAFPMMEDYLAAHNEHG